jgi:hypothetical protein
MPQRGLGSIYRRKDSRFWWMNFVDETGAPVNKSTKRVDKREAMQVLRSFQEAVQQGL